MKNPRRLDKINLIAISTSILMTVLSAFGLENFFRIIHGAIRDSVYPENLLYIERKEIIIFVLCLICSLFVCLGANKRWLITISLAWGVLCLLPLFELNYYSFIKDIFDIWLDSTSRALNWRSLKLAFNNQWYFAATFILMICLCITQSINLWRQKNQNTDNAELN